MSSKHQETCVCVEKHLSNVSANFNFKENKNTLFKIIQFDFRSLTLQQYYIAIGDQHALILIWLIFISAPHRYHMNCIIKINSSLLCFPD